MKLNGNKTNLAGIALILNAVVPAFTEGGFSLEKVDLQGVLLGFAVLFGRHAIAKSEKK